MEFKDVFAAYWTTFCILESNNTDNLIKLFIVIISYDGHLRSSTGWNQSGDTAGPGGYMDQ